MGRWKRSVLKVCFKSSVSSGRQEAPAPCPSVRASVRLVCQLHLRLVRCVDVSELLEPAANVTEPESRCLLGRGLTQLLGRILDHLSTGSPPRGPSRTSTLSSRLPAPARFQAVSLVLERSGDGVLSPGSVDLAMLIRFIRIHESYNNDGNNHIRKHPYSAYLHQVAILNLCPVIFHAKTKSTSSKVIPVSVGLQNCKIS